MVDIANFEYPLFSCWARHCRRPPIPEAPFRYLTAATFQPAPRGSIVPPRSPEGTVFQTRLDRRVTKPEDAFWSATTAWALQGVPHVSGSLVRPKSGAFSSKPAEKKGL